MNLKQKIRNIGLFMAVFGGGCGFVLRRIFLLGGTAAPLWVFSALILIALGGLSWILKPDNLYRNCFSDQTIWMVVSLLGAVLLLVGNGLEIVQGGGLIVPCLGLATAFSIAVIAINRMRGVVSSVGVHAMACVYLVVKLILEFRVWSIDPSLMDYCFSLFAAICTMLATCQIGYFVFDKGRRRQTTFWCLAGAVFSGCAMADGGTSALLLGGMGLWVLANGGQLLED